MLDAIFAWFGKLFDLVVHLLGGAMFFAIIGGSVIIGCLLVYSVISFTWKKPKEAILGTFEILLPYILGFAAFFLLQDHIGKGWSGLVAVVVWYKSTLYAEKLGWAKQLDE